MRVGLQKISHSRGLHKEIRLQVEQREVELPSIEGLIFINIPRCAGAAATRLCRRRLGWALGLTLVHPAVSRAAGAQELTSGALTATQGLRSHAWMMGCWR